MTDKTGGPAKPHVWVIEMQREDGTYAPRSDAQITRADAMRERYFYWQENYPKGKFRVQKYVRAK